MSCTSLENWGGKNKELSAYNHIWSLNSLQKSKQIKKYSRQRYRTFSVFPGSFLWWNNLWGNEVCRHKRDTTPGFPCHFPAPPWSKRNLPSTYTPTLPVLCGLLGNKRTAACSMAGVEDEELPCSELESASHQPNIALKVTRDQLTKFQNSSESSQALAIKIDTDSWYHLLC